MARTRRDSKIDSANARAALAPRKSPYRITLEEGRYLGYRKPSSGKAGTWIAIYYSPDSKKFLEKALKPADDFTPADGVMVLNWSQALKEARSWFEVAHRIATGERVRRTDITVHEAYQEYRKTAALRGVKTVSRIDAVFEHYIGPAFGSRPVDSLKARELEAWHLNLASAPYAPRRPRKDREITLEDLASMSPAGRRPETKEEKRQRKCTANRILMVTKAMLNHVRNRGLTDAAGEAWGTVQLFKKVDRARTRYLNPLEMVQLLTACPPDFARLAQGALHTGCRYAELCRLKVQDYHPDGAGGRGTVFVSESKSGRSRHVILAPEGRAFFELMVAGRRSAEPMFLRVARPYVGAPAAASIIREWRPSENTPFMKAALEAAGLEPMTFHELRHTYASMLVNRGVPLAFVAQQLGHADTRQVEAHYGHLCPSAAADAITTLVPHPRQKPPHHPEVGFTSG